MSKKLKLRKTPTVPARRSVIEQRVFNNTNAQAAVKGKGKQPVQDATNIHRCKEQRGDPAEQPIGRSYEIAYSMKELELDKNDEEGLELLNLSLGLIYLQKYTKKHKLCSLDGLSSKLRAELMKAMSHIKSLKQQTEGENESRQKDLQMIAVKQESFQRETEYLKEELEKYRFNSCKGNQIHHFEKEFEKNKHTLERKYEEEEIQCKVFAPSFHEKIASQQQTIMHLKREIENRDLTTKRLEEKSKSCKNLEEEEIFELRYQLQESFAKVKESEAALLEAQSEIEHEQRMRKEFERLAREYQICSQRLQEANNELSMSEIAFQNTLIKLQKTEDELQNAKTGKELEMRNRQKLQKQVSEHKERIIFLEKENETLETSQKQIKEHFENELEQRYQKLERKGKLYEVERNKLREEINETKDKLLEMTSQHQNTLAKLKEREDKLAKTNSEKEAERRKRQESERNKSVYEHRIKLSKNENLEVLQLKEQRINQLEREVKTKEHEKRYLEASLSKMKQETNDKSKLREELKYNQDQLAELRNRMKHVLMKWEKTEDELVKTKFEMSKRNEIEITVSEYQNRIKQIERGTMENMTSQNQIVQNLKKDLEASNKSLNHEVSEKHQLKKDLKETDDRLLELECQHQHTLETLETIKAKVETERRIRKEWERKANENENRIEQTRNEKDEILKLQGQRIIQFESMVQDKDREIKVLEDSSHSMKHDNSDIITLNKELKESKYKLSKAENQLQQVLAKLKKAEVDSQETNAEQEHILLMSNEIEKKANEYQNCIQHLEKENAKVLTSHELIIQDLKEEVKCKDNQLKALQNSLDKTKNADRHRLREESHTIIDQLSELGYKHNQTVAKLSETEAQLDEARHECQSEQQTRAELERKISKLENQLEDTKKINKQTIAIQKENIDALGKKAEDKDRQINNLEALVETLNREVSEGSQLKEDLKETEYKLSQLEKQHQQTLERLRSMEAELVRTLSDKESEWRNRKELERKARENENRIEQTKSDNDEMLQSQKQIINELTFEVEEKDREIIALQASE